MRHTWIVATLVAFTFAADALAADAKQMVVVPFEAAQFVPLDPARPEGTAVAVLWGDPGAGPSAMLMKMKRTDGRLHFHSSDYHLSLLQGTMKHWADGADPAEAKSMGPGSYWFQPGGEVHADSCLTDECIMFIKWEGKRDGFLPRTNASRE